MIKASLTAPTDIITEEVLLDTMLNCYENHIADHSLIFPGMEQTLETIEAQGLKWGVVTNKRERFTSPLMAALKLTGRTACIISGDTTSKEKNLVWSAKEVNQRKADRLPHEAGLKLLSVPRAPKEMPVSALIRNTSQVEDWKPFLT